MYESIVKTPDEALCHLFLHCCMKDGKLASGELDQAADKIVRFNIHKNVDVKLETKRYVEYHSSIADQREYLNYLVKVIMPINSLAIYSYCVELILGDDQIQPAEESLLTTIAEAFQIAAEERQVVQKLLVQRKIVEGQKLF